MGRKRIHVGRRVGKIGFLGKGMSVRSRESSDIAHALASRVGDDKISTDEDECERYRHDFAPHRKVLSRIFSRTPEVIAFPDSGQCAADMLDVCIEEKTPAVPRGGGRAGLGGAMPVRGGVVVDVSRMARVISIDRSGGTVTVEAGCTWKGLEENLSMEDLSLRCYPANAGSATVGGWMSTGGYGVGTHREGKFHEQVASVEVALASGLLVNSAKGEGRYATRSFSGTEGQMGVITKLTLPVKTRPERRAYYLIRLNKEEDGFEILTRLSRVDSPPFSTRLIGENRARLFGKKTGIETGDAGLISVVEEGDDTCINRCEAMLKDLALAAGLEVDAGGDASEVQGETSTYLAAVNEGSVRLAGEILIETDRARRLRATLGRRTRSGEDLLCECRLVDSGRALFAVGILNDRAAGRGPTRDVLATGRVVARGVKAGGIPYGIGLWNSPYSKRILGGDFRDLSRIKREIDRLGLFNPGKVFAMTTSSSFPVPGWAYRCAVGLTGRL
ncbi:MAG: FAD-binding oxidoreductase [Candidatus Eisenbacteria bacterium]